MSDAFAYFAESVFALSPAVRYVAVNSQGTVHMASRSRANASAQESDRYEELLVNPAVLELVRRRGDIDCGGATFVLVRYGNFYQLIVPMPWGHASIAIELGADLVAVADRCIAHLADAAQSAPT